MRHVPVLFALLMVSPRARADVALADVFSELAVLQRGRKVPIWGTADPGEAVSVTFEGQTAKAEADASGRWRVEIGPFDPVAARPLVVTGAKNKVELERVFVGDVWICSGQSNMEWPLEKTDGAADELKRCSDPRLLLYTVRHKVSPEPVAEAGGRWRRTTEETARGFSAVAYYFGQELRRELGVPIGLIQTTWGGTPAESWTRRATLLQHEETRPIVERWDRALAEHPERSAAWKDAVAAWQEAGSKGRRPAPPPGPGHPSRPSGLYGGMIAPVVPYAIRGVIWYQGESNATRAEQYRTLFPAMIRDWREAWGQGEFPFYFVQLAGFRAFRAEPGPSDWAELRDAQRFALREPDTGMAVTLDIGDANDIHPRNKREVGARLARLARARLYGADVVESGPLYGSHAIADGAVTLRFTQAKGLGARGDDPLRGFSIAGEDRRFRWAHARIEGDTVVVSHPRVPNPVAVRYAWADHPIANLVNAAGLPASPFRTDDWPEGTAGRR